jgi:integrase
MIAYASGWNTPAAPGRLMAWFSPPVPAGQSSPAQSATASTCGALRLASAASASVHDTRRTCGSLLAALDVHPRIAMQTLRHSKIAITMEIYAMVPDKNTLAALKQLSDALGSPDAEVPGDVD